MTRLRADLLLLITAIVWGTAFVAQKTGMEGVGPFGFAGVRFVFSLMVVFPLVMLEARHGRGVAFTRQDWWITALMCMAFIGGVILQQAGILHTTVTNAGFLTGLYVVIVPFIVWIMFRTPPAPVIWAASLLAIAGVWLLNGASLTSIGLGDWLVVGCAACFAVQVVLMGVLARRTRRPMLLSAVQYAACAIVGTGLGIGFEGLNLEAVQIDLWPLLYAGVISGGIGYTLQAVAQQHTPSSDAAIIMSGEALFAALAGAILMGDRLDFMGWAGCGMIFAAILLVEAGVLLFSRLKSSKTVS
jgi:drug/metabolite transporter (DMT)-like permease